MKDQERELRQKNVSALAFTAVAIKVDPNIWKRLEQREYLVIFIFSKIVFTLQSHFWKYIIGKKSNEFYYHLVCIAIDEVYLI